MVEALLFTPQARKLLRDVYAAINNNDAPADLRLAILCQLAGAVTMELYPDDPDRMPRRLYGIVLENVMLGREYAKDPL